MTITHTSDASAARSDGQSYSAVILQIDSFDQWSNPAGAAMVSWCVATAGSQPAA